MKELDMMFMISIRIMAGSYMIFMKFLNVERKNLVRKLLRKRALIITKAIP